MRTRFDSQATNYDRRAGLPEAAIGEIVRSIAEIAEAPTGGLLLEVGPGTGQIGCELCKLPLRYVGFDISAAMLQQFRQRLEPGGVTPELIVADGNRKWPLADASADVLFSSRALHLLDHEHVVVELFRVASTEGAVLLTGSVRRAEHSVKEQMRRQLRQFLQEHAIEGRSRDASRQRIFQHCCAIGAKRLSPRVAASWFVSHTPRQSIESWDNKEGLVGTDVPANVKKSVLTRLQAWALTQYKDLQQPSEMEESYVLEGVRIPARRES